ncbi:MAG: hypothetical protein ACK2UK_07420 [Candidatus Promineifilaceae bacterium]
MRAILAVLFLLPVMMVAQVAAHGGGALVAGPVATGPYMVSVWVNPPQPRAGAPVHFTVGVAAPGDGAPVLDAQILITMAQTEQTASPIASSATTEQSINRLFYETDLDIEQPGLYATTIAVSGPAGSGELALDLEVLPPARFNWFWLGLAGLAFVLLLGIWQRRRTPSD